MEVLHQVNVLRKRVDANEPCDPHVNDDQMILETFESFDNDNNGQLDEYEFRNALKTMGVDNIDDDSRQGGSIIDDRSLYSNRIWGERMNVC